MLQFVFFVMYVDLKSVNQYVHKIFKQKIYKSIKYNSVCVIIFYYD
jgi:hypothetical protein